MSNGLTHFSPDLRVGRDLLESAILSMDQPAAAYSSVISTAPSRMQVELPFFISPVTS